MKYFYYTLILFFSITTSSYSQLTGPRRGESNLLTEHNIDLKKIKGSPYEKEKFDIGKIKDDITGKEKKCYIRYNAITDDIEIKENLKKGSEIASMIKSNGIYAISNNKIYRPYSFTTTDGEFISRISIILLDETPLKIIKIIEKEIIAAEKAQTSYQKDKPAQLKTIIRYFIQKGLDTKKVKLNKKKIIKSLPDNHKKVEKFIKDNKIKGKSETDLIQIITFYNSISK